MLVLFFFLGFKLHTQEELKFEERLGKFQNNQQDESMKVTPTKLIRDAYHGCNPTGDFRNENKGWVHNAQFPSGKDAWIACEGNGTSGSKLTLSGNQMNMIHNRNRQSINGLIYVNNADFECTINEFYACAANCSKGLCITFEGSGTHSITGSRFNYCGMRSTSDGSVVYIGGNSQNTFNDVKFDTGDGKGNPQKWEIAPSRALRICNQSSLVYNQMHCFNHTSDTGGGFLKMETTGYVNITKGNVIFCCDRSADPKAAVYKVSTGFLKLETLNINGCGFQEGQTGATTLWMENSNFEIINCEIKFDPKFAAKACVGLKVIQKGYFRINSNKFLACQRGVIYLGKEGGDEDAEIKDNHFNQLTQAVEGCAIEAFLWNESTVFTGNLFNELPPNVPAIKIVFQGTLSKDNYTVYNQRFTGFRTSGNGNAFLISTRENKPVVFNNCFFINNSAGEKGGALCFTVPVHFLFCQFDGNQAKFGGALAFEIQRSCSIQYCKFYNNTAREKGGALYISYSASARDGLEEFEFIGCDFEGNTGKESHCIYIQRSEVTLKIHSCNFFNNFFTDTFQSGSCVVSEAVETIVTFCVFKNDNFTKACGGINVTRKSILNVTNCLFEKCHAGNIDKYGGGGIAYCNKTSGDNEDINIKDCVFRNNTGCNGVAILLQPTSSFPSIEKCTIEFHENTKFIFCVFFIMETDGHDFVIQECNFYNNSHDNSQDTSAGANGIWIAEAERPTIIDNDNQMNLIFRDCEFKDSHARGFGGAFSYGLSARLQGVELTFDHCDFVGNSCDRENGGCLYFYTMRPVSILYCTFENNEAKAVGASSNAAGGGAIFLHKSVSELTIFNCTFHNCRASTGSYIYANGDSMDSINISKCLFSNIPDKQNNSIYIKLPQKNDHFEFNENIFDSLHCTGTNGGSGLHIKAEKDYELKSCQFIDCYYNGRKENGMFYIGESSDALLTLFNCTFEEKNGVSEETNRAVWIEQEQGLEIIQCTFKNFWKVDRTGAALLSKSQTKSNSFYNCTFENLIGWSCIHFEHCKEIDLELCKFTNVTVGGFTGIIYNNESEEFHLLNCTFTECGGSNKPTHKSIDTGAIGLCNKVTNASIINCEFIRCRTNDVNRNINGGAINVKGGKVQNLLIENCIFEECSSSYPGRNNFGLAIYIGDSNHVEINKCNFKNSINTNNVTAGMSYYSEGNPSIYSNARELIFTHNTIEDTLEDGAGAGLYCVKDKCQILHVAYNKFLNIKKKYGLYYEGPGEEIIIENNTFDGIKGGNSCSFCIKDSKGSPIFRSNIIKNHPYENITSGDYDMQYVGRIEGQGTTVCESCNFTGNVVHSTSGGGSGMILKSSTSHYLNCRFENNQAYCPYDKTTGDLAFQGQGGGLCIDTTEILGNSNTIIEDCIFDNNKGDKEGGAVAILLSNGRQVRICNCQFLHNQGATQDFNSGEKNNKFGGAVYINGVGEVSIERCIFQKNQAFNGHAIYSLGEGQVWIKDECQFIDNSQNSESQIAIGGSNFDFSNSTISLSNGAQSFSRVISLLSGGSMNIHDATIRDIKSADSIGNAIFIEKGAVHGLVSNVSFIDVGTGKGSAIYCDGSSIDILDNKFIFNKGGDQVSSSIEINSTSSRKCTFNIFNNLFHRSKMAFIYTALEKGSYTPELIIESNTFEDCYAINPCCFEINTYHLFEFNFNKIIKQNPGNQYHLGAIYFHANLINQETFTLSNNYFGENLCNSDYGGGTGLFICNKDEPTNSYPLFTLRFEHCIFYKNGARFSYNDKRGRDNGKGGAFQIGFTESTSNINLEMDNCTFTDNHADKDGGALSIETIGTVKIMNCVFQDNGAGTASRGGSIYFEPDFDHPQGHHNESSCELIEISNTNFSNSDAFNAAAIYCKGGTKQTVLTITENCIFTDNGNKGCSILSEAKKLDMSDSTIQFVSQKARGLETKGETLLTNVKFINNTNNDGNGCALYVPPESEFVRINNCLFDGCGSGGNTSHAPVVIESAPVIFDGSNITFPDANKGIKALDIRAYGLITISNNRISNTNTRGALLYNPSDKFGNPKNENLTIEGNIFDNCLGPNARCFEIFLHSSNVIFSGNTIQNCVEGSNSYLGVIDGLGFLTSFTFDHCVFKNLVTSSDFGGASGLWIANNRQLLNINFESCVWENNRASVQNGDLRCRGHGGAFQCGMTQTVSNVVLRFSDCLFSSNYAEREGGALALHVQGNIIIERCKFNDNHAGQGTMTQVNRGGAIVIHPNYQYGNEIHNVADSINIINCSFNGNFALTDGNAIYIPYATTTDVSVLGSSFYRDSYNRQSSTIVVGAKSLLIDNITLSYEDNLTSRGIWENSTTFTLYNSEFTRCGHQEDGQALNIREATNSAIVDTCKFIDCGYNTNTLSVIVQVCKDFTFTQSEITFTRKKPEYIAAGIYCAYKCSFKLIDSNFTKCLCNTNKAGGAIVYKGMDRPGYTEDIVLDGCVFDNNSNPNALSACAIRITCTSVPELKDVTIKNHNDTSFIVAIFFSEHLRQEVILDHWVFENNCFTSEGRETDDCGGCGLWIAPEKTTAGYKDSWPLTFETCTWRNNHANKLGGAFAYGYSNTLRYIYLNFSKCIFENNICDGDKGGALSFNSQVEVKITKCTFRGNEAKGQHLGHALYVDRRCHVVISGSKFYDNGDTFSTSVVQHSGKQLDFIESEISFSTTEKGCRGIDMDYTGRMNLINSTFTRCNAGVGANSITTFHGGAIRYYKPSDSILDEEITIDGCIFDSNIAGNGCVMVLSTSTVPVLTRNIVKNQNTGRFILSVFFVAFQDVCVVENMEFKNCSCTQGDDSGGSGIWIANQEQISNGRPASLIFRNCTWENNRTPNKGGALHYGNSKTLVGMELTFDKCNFIGNQAQGTGGAVSLLTKSPIVFNECKFTNNHVTPKNANEKSRGSSIFVDSTTPLVSITGCVFNNETADDGNAIFVTSQVPACFVSGCYFQNCGVTGTVVVLECQEILFENNDILFDRVEKACRGLEIRTIAVTTISGSKFQKCRTIGSMAEADRHTWGAGIYLNNSLQSQEQEDFTMEECEFDACEGPNGCAICLNMSSAPVIRSTLCQNHRSGKYIFSIFCTTYFQDLFTIESCTFCNNQFQNSNKEDGGGSAIWISNDQYLLPGTPTKINFKNCNWTKNSGVYGGAFSYGKSDTVSNTELVFEKCHFENNQASGDMGGALFLFTIQPIYIDGCTFINNKVLNNIGKGSQALGGAITLDTSATTCTIIGTTFRKNGAQNGNALYVTEKTAYVELIDSHFLSNSNGNVGSQVLHNGKEIHATNTNFDYETITLHARGVEIINKSMSYFVKCNFTLCETDGWGGGLYINDDVNSKNEEQLTLDGCIFDSCSASNGSAVLCEIMCNPTISHCTVKNMKSGAYVFCFFFREFQEYVTVEECTFQDLKLNKQTTLDGGGSGIWIATDKKLYNGTSSKLTFNKCNFINNVAETNGGAISYGDSPTLKTTFLQFKECLFEGNTANGAQGGALWFTGDEPMLVSKCTFKNNKAVGANNLGGHIYVDSPSEQIQIYDSSFDSSNAQKGNAIYAETKTKSLQIYGVTFDNCGTSNTVITSNAKDFQLSTSKIIFNESAPSKSARGIDLQIKSTTTITQTDFINCYSTQQGGAIYVDHGNGDSELNESMSITDCTFDGCYGTNGAAMFMRINDQPVLRGNVIKNSRGGNYIISIFYLKFIEYTLLDNCNFENNYLGPTSTADGGGSGIWIAPDKGVADNEIKYLTFSDCTFIGNSVAGSGGAFSYGGSATVKHTVLSFEACRFYHNIALGSGQEAGGGALYLRTTQPVFISKCLFDNNTATYGTGGALYIHTESNVTIENTQIARNQAAEKTSGIYINNEHQLTLFNSTIASNSAAGNNLAASLYLNNEGTAAIDQCKFDFTRQTSQYQITLTGTASSSTLSFNKCCFTHKGTSDETLTHILSTIAGKINVPAGNCFDTSESAGFQHGGGGSVNKEKGIFNCNNCEDIYIPTAAPDPTPKATPERTIEPSDLTSLPTSIPTQIPSIDINETSDFNESSSTDNTVDDGNDNSKKVGMIAGIAIGSIVIIVVIIVLLWLFVLRGRSLQHKSDSENASEMNDETISGISGIDTTQDDPIWAGTTATQDNPLFNGGDDEQDEDDQMITNDFEESWGDSVI